jgi:hypothetical protein
MSIFARSLHFALACRYASLAAIAAMPLQPAHADVVYQLEDGSSELAIGIDPGEDQIWFNRFAVQPGGETIVSISAAYGRPGGPSALNGLPVTIVLYEDSNGGLPWDATLRRTVSTVVANGNTNILNTYPITPITVHGSVLVGVLYRNTTAVNKFIGALDTTAPHIANASYAAFAIGLKEGDLQSLPPGNFNSTEGLGFPGNFLIRANAIPGPGLGDVNFDGHVNIDDLLAVINAWGRCPDPCASCAADLSFSCTVDIDDLLEVINNWG